jgi:hypothetical protein
LRQGDAVAWTRLPVLVAGGGDAGGLADEALPPLGVPVLPLRDYDAYGNGVFLIRSDG